MTDHPNALIHSYLVHPAARQADELAEPRDDLRRAGEALTAARAKRDGLAARLASARAIEERVGTLRDAAKEAMRLAGEAHAKRIAGTGTEEAEMEADAIAAEADASLRAALGGAGDDLAVLEHGDSLLKAAEAEFAAAEMAARDALIAYGSARIAWSERQAATKFAAHVAPFQADAAAMHRVVRDILRRPLEGFEVWREAEREGWRASPLGGVGEVAAVIGGAVRRAGGLPDGARLNAGPSAAVSWGTKFQLGGTPNGG